MFYTVNDMVLVKILLLQRHKGVADPLEVVAGEISDEAILLCLDEFMVSEIIILLSFSC